MSILAFIKFHPLNVLNRRSNILSILLLRILSGLLIFYVLLNFDYNVRNNVCQTSWKGGRAIPNTILTRYHASS